MFKQYVKTDVDMGETYSVWVTAINGAGESDPTLPQDVVVSAFASGYFAASFSVQQNIFYVVFSFSTGTNLFVFADLDRDVDVRRRFGLSVCRRTRAHSLLVQKRVRLYLKNTQDSKYQYRLGFSLLF